MITLSFGHTPRHGSPPDDVRLALFVNCERCGWSHSIYMADIFGSYAGVGNSLWKIFDHWFNCA